MGSLFKRPEFLAILKKMGYTPDRDGFKACIEKEIHNFNTRALADKLGMHRICLKRWMKEFDIDNPNKPGGNNNPSGFYGAKGSRRDLDKGVMHSKPNKRKRSKAVA